MFTPNHFPRISRPYYLTGAAILVSGLLLAGFYVTWSGRALSRPSVPEPPSAVAAAAATPDSSIAPLRNARRSLESISQAANAGDWESALEQFRAFQQLTQNMPAPELRHPDVSMVLLDFFTFYQVQLQRAIDRHELERVHFAGNQLHGIIEDLISHVNPTTPRELARLRYLSRDIGYWASAGDEQMLQVRAVGLGRLWDDLRPVVVDRNGRKAAENFDSVLSQLEAAEAPADIQSLTPQLHDAVKQVEAVLAKN